MYEERKNKFSLKDIILQLLLVVLFVFMMIWLFPTKNYLKENGAIVENDLYNNYLLIMRDAGKDYFTTDRVPTKVGDSVTLTLTKMLEEKLLFPIGGNAQCNLEESYVSVTKMDKNYQMKVQLTCEDYSNYIMITLGCRNFCDVKEETKVETPVVKPQTKPQTPVVTPQEKPQTKPQTPVETPQEKPQEVTKVTEYKYYLKTSTPYTYYSDWSEWKSMSKDGVVNPTGTDLVEIVEVDVHEDIVGYEKECTNKTLYKTETVVVDTKDAVTKTQNKKVYGKVNKTSNVEYGEWVYEGYIRSQVPLADEDTIDYEYVSHSTTRDCEDECTLVTNYIYKKWTRTATKTTEYSCSTGYTKTGTGSNTKCYKTVEEKVATCASYGSDYKLENNKCVKYGTQNVANGQEQVCKDGAPIYEKYTTWKERTRSLETGYNYSEDTIWSLNGNDTDLLSKGYTIVDTRETTNVTNS